MSAVFPVTIKTIAIVGGGVSGTLVAANLLRFARAPLRVILIERQGPVGPGVAYRTSCPDHVLNVSAGRMSAWPEQPGDFVLWLARHRGEAGIPAEVNASDFLPRVLYGRYVASVFAEVRRKAPPDVDCEIVEGEAVDLEESGAGGLLTLADGRTIVADEVVLALGNLPGEYPIPRALPVYHHPRYVHVPWRGNVLEGLGADDDLLLVGQGLTASDLIVQLDRAGHRGTIHALSRHGLQPKVHEPYAAYPSFLASEPPPATVRALLRCVRREIRAAEKAGSNWRAVIDGLRPYAQEIWQKFSPDERARFMRHVRSYWEIHRHRLAPQVAAVIARRVEQGTLKFHAGRLQVLEANAAGVQALFRRKATIHHVSLNVAKVINCTGPRTDYSKYQHPLLIHLLARGLIDHDALALGINALPTGEVLRYRGGPVGWLHTLGAPLKGVLWETTAVPEIRLQARDLAGRLAGASVPTAG